MTVKTIEILAPLPEDKHDVTGGGRAGPHQIGMQKPTMAR